MTRRVGPAPRVPARYVQASVVEPEDGPPIVTVADFEEGAGNKEFVVFRVGPDESLTEVGRGYGA